ncbi:lipopolysaccharide biosynthesis protein [Nocardioides terrisoli]|uniref:lipopolysaccharide biosynthesis protein n=1 Tax=Nocardioides terrisoli TaxID=3388267 RepID=UPI00287BB138|nr:hypothetical protein [Nocardioides marmorisolisilvae]
MRSGTRKTVPALVSTYIVVGCIGLVFGAILMLGELVSPVLVHRLVGELGSPLLLVLAVLGFNSIWISSAFSRAAGRGTVAILLENALLAIWLTIVLLPWALQSRTPPLWVVAIAMCAIAPMLVVPVLLRFRREAGRGAAVSSLRHAARGLIGYGAVTVTNSIIVWVPVQVLGYFGKLPEVGVYNAAFRVTMLIGAFGVILKSAVIGQRIAAGNDDHRGDDRWPLIRRSVALTIPFVLVSLVIAWQGRLLSSAFGGGFAEMKTILPVMLIAQSINVGGFLIETTFVLRGDRRALNMNAAVTFAVAVVAAPLLVGTYGLHGAAWSFALTTVLSRVHLAFLYVIRGPQQGREGMGERRSIRVVKDAELGG